MARAGLCGGCAAPRGGVLRSQARSCWRAQDGMTPLMAACMARSEPCVGMLIVAGADVNAVNAHGDTALHCASDAGSVACANLLIFAGGDLRALDRVRRCARTRTRVLVKRGWSG